MTCGNFVYENQKGDILFRPLFDTQEMYNYIIKFYFQFSILSLKVEQYH